MKKCIAFLLAAVFLTAGHPPEQAQPLKPNSDHLLFYQDFILKKMDDFSVSSVDRFSDKINSLIDTYLGTDNRVFYAVIPDKEYFVRDQVDHPFDYIQMESHLKNAIHAQYTPLFDALSLEDYYRYDLHWRQENLQEVVNVLGNALDFRVDLSDFEVKTYPSAIGAYARDNENLTENLAYLTNAWTEQCVVDNFQDQAFTKVYNLEKLHSKTSYDVFLSGVSPLITLKNPQAKNERRLILFRDSFASSLAPLLIGEYAEITLIDLRFLMSDQLSELVDFSGADVLFLYCADVVNHSRILR